MLGKWWEAFPFVTPRPFFQVDLIFVFFDPIGQALCKRTLNIVEALSEKHSERIRFYLSKADEVSCMFRDIFIFTAYLYERVDVYYSGVLFN